MIFQYSASCISRTGKVRSINEDNFYFNGKSLSANNKGINKAIYSDGTTKEPHVLGVFDGMGGEIGGEFAAATAADSLNEQTNKLTTTAMQPRTFLNTVVQFMNEAVYKNSQSHGFARCGTTVAIFYSALEQFYICNVGDSRIYRYSHNKLEQLSEDDIVFNPAVKNQTLSQYIGVDSSRYAIKPHIKKGTIHHKDIYLLCTDGLYNAVSDTEISRILEDFRDDLPLCAEKLVNAAENNDGDDNCTVIVIQFNRKSWLSKLLSNL